ncbi:hypothetical protein FEF09_27295, partial [Chitinophaga pinensis]
MYDAANSIRRPAGYVNQEIKVPAVLKRRNLVDELLFAIVYLVSLLPVWALKVIEKLLYGSFTGHQIQIRCSGAESFAFLSDKSYRQIKVMA